MAASPEVINLGSYTGTPKPVEEITLTIDPLPSANFGPGVELLMNEKRKEGGGSTPTKDIDIDDLDKLEHDLNNLSADVDRVHGTGPVVDFAKPTVSFGEATRSMFSAPAPGVTPDPSVAAGASPPGTPSGAAPSVGKDTAKTGDQEKTWDGYSSFNNIPIDPDKAVPQAAKMSPEELLRKKFSVLRKLEALEAKGVSLTKKYSMDSPLAEMLGEYENIMAEKEKSNSMKFQGKMLMAMITGLEFLNNKFDPFDLKLDGWAEQVNENIEDYDDIFAQLHEKYQSKATMAPELKLLFQLGGGAIMLHMTNTMFKSSMPGMDDIMRQNPELMQKFTQAAVGTVGAGSPGFSGFMNNVMHDHVPAAQPQVPSRTRQSEPAPRQSPYNVQKARPEEPPRPEMKGPTDINDILGGLKSKTINLSDPVKDDGSVISLSELKEMKGDLSAVPTKSRRRKSDKNSVSLL